MSSRGEESVFPAPRLGARRAPPAKVATHSLKPTNKSWRVDETYVRVKGGWCYLYRAIDSTGATIDFLLSALRDAAAAKRLFRKALSDPSHPQPRVINTDQARLYGSAIPAVKEDGTLRCRCRHRPVQSLNNILEQDHRAIKRRVKAKKGFREFHAARRTIQGVLAPVAVDRSPSPPRSWAKTAGSPQGHVSDARDRRDGLRQARV